MGIKFNMKKIFFNLFLVGGLGISAFTNGNSQEAVATVAVTGEKSAIALYNEGLEALKAKDFKTSFTTFEAAIAKATADKNEEVLGLSKKNIVSAGYSYGNALLTEKNNKEALNIFQKVLAIDPAANLMYQGIGKAKETDGDIDGAADAYMSYLDGGIAEKSDKKIGDARSRVKNMLIKQLAAKSYSKITKIGVSYLAKDSHSDIAYLVGKAYADSGNAKSGIQYLQQTVELSGKEGTKVEDKVYFALGQSYEKTKDKANAIKYLSLITDPKFKPSATAMIDALKK